METDYESRLMDILNELSQGEQPIMTLDEDKVALVRRLYQIVENITTGGKVELVLFKPFPNMGSISVEGKKVIFEDTGLFAEIAKIADNINVYGKTNGKIHVDFTFYGLQNFQKGK